jgi:hypothetical protein
MCRNKLHEGQLSCQESRVSSPTRNVPRNEAQNHITSVSICDTCCSDILACIDYRYVQCCGSGMICSDPDPYFQIVTAPEPGSCFGSYMNFV